MDLEVLRGDTPHIAFCGSSGTGKTTLAKWLAEELGVPFNPVGARSVATFMGFATKEGEARPYAVDRAGLQAYLEVVPNFEGSTQEQRKLAATTALLNPDGPNCRLLFQGEVQRQKIAWEDDHWIEGFVTDRSSIDDLTYCSLHGIRGIQEDYLDRALVHCSKYSAIFMAPVSAFHHVGTDGARVDSLAYHRIFETLLEGLIFSISHVDINGIFWHLGMSGMEERKDYIASILGIRRGHG